jgi:hypothetical protein
MMIRLQPENVTALDNLAFLEPDEGVNQDRARAQDNPIPQDLR